MGAALSSRRPTAGLALGDGDQQLLGEFIGHSRAAVDECAAIFRGPDAALDDDQDDDGGVAFPAAEREQEAARDGNGGRRLKNRQLRRGGRRTAYPRRLSPSQFDEIFGMLVADAEPHFAFFQAPGVPPVVIAHQVFCCVALLMSADLRAKVDFVLRLYADAVGHLAPEVKRLLLSDAVASVTRLTGASDPVPSETLAHLEVHAPGLTVGKVVRHWLTLWRWCRGRSSATRPASWRRRASSSTSASRTRGSAACCTTSTPAS